MKRIAKDEGRKRKKLMTRRGEEYCTFDSNVRIVSFKKEGKRKTGIDRDFSPEK